LVVAVCDAPFDEEFFALIDDDGCGLDGDG